MVDPLKQAKHTHTHIPKDPQKALCATSPLVSPPGPGNGFHPARSMVERHQLLMMAPARSQNLASERTRTPQTPESSVAWNRTQPTP